MYFYVTIVIIVNEFNTLLFANKKFQIKYLQISTHKSKQ